MYLYDEAITLKFQRKLLKSKVSASHTELRQQESLRETPLHTCLWFPGLFSCPVQSPLQFACPTALLLYTAQFVCNVIMSCKRKPELKPVSITGLKIGFIYCTYICVTVIYWNFGLVYKQYHTRRCAFPSILIWGTVKFSFFLCCTRLVFNILCMPITFSPFSLLLCQCKM